MMNTRIGLLFGVLLAQLLLTGIAFFATRGPDEPEPLLALDAGSVSGIVIADGEGATVTLSRAGDGWQVGSLPADADKVAKVIDTLAGGGAGWPVAVSAESRERFEVTEGAHQRRIAFLDGEATLGVVYLGTSPGFRRVHARRDGEDAVFGIDFAVHEVPTSVDDWLDKQLLAGSAVSRVTLAGGQVLASDGEAGGWVLDGTPADAEAARRYVERFERLSVLGLEEDSDDTLPGEPRTLIVEDSGGTQQLTFYLDEEADEYRVTSDRFDVTFSVASYVAEQLLADPADLLPDPPADDEAADVAEPAAADEDPDA